MQGGHKVEASLVTAHVKLYANLTLVHVTQRRRLID